MTLFLGPVLFSFPRHGNFPTLSTSLSGLFDVGQMSPTHPNRSTVTRRDDYILDLSIIMRITVD